MWEDIKNEARRLFGLTTPKEMEERRKREEEDRELTARLAQEKREALPRMTIQTEQNDITHVWLNGNSESLASVGRSGSVEIWNVGEKRRERTLKLANTISQAAWSLDGRRLATMSDEENAPIAVWDMETGMLLAEWMVSEATQVSGLWLSPDGTTLAVTASQMSPQESRLEFGRADRLRVTRYDVDSGKRLSEWEEPAPVGEVSAQVAPDGRTLARVVVKGKDEVGKKQFAIVVSDLESGNVLGEFGETAESISGRGPEIQQFSIDGRLLLCYQNGTSPIFDYRNEIGDEFSEYRIWNWAARETLATLDYANLRNWLGYTLCGTDRYGGVNYERVTFWDVVGNGRVAERISPKERDRRIGWPSFSADGRWMARAGSDGEVFVWDVPERRK